MRKNNVVTYLISDHLGSTSLVTDSSGAVINQTKYKAWGETRYSSGTEQTKYTYTGQYSYVSDFGLHFYNARWYDSSLSRFAQADTIVPSGSQGLDRYAYVNNSPMMYTDPSGHVLCDADGNCGKPSLTKKPTNKQNQEPTAAEKRVLSLLGIDSYSEYEEWYSQNSELKSVLENAEAGDIVKFNYTGTNGEQLSVDWMVMEYQDGYTFYDVNRRERMSSETAGFADIWSNRVTSAGAYSINSEGAYTLERGTSNFTDTGMYLSDNWNKPKNGGIVAWSPQDPWTSLSAYAGLTMLLLSPVPDELFYTVVLAGSGGVTAGAGFANIDLVPVYKDHPYGP